MPDDPKIDNKEQEGTDNAGKGGPAPDFNSDAFKAQMREAVAQYLETEAKDQQYQQPVYQQPQQQVQQDPAENPIRQVLDPIYGNEIRLARLEAASARDQSLFYTQHPEAVRYMKDIEQIHVARLQQGIPDTRETVWNFYKGANQDKFFQEREEAEKKKLEQANLVADMGGGFRPNPQAKDPHVMNDEELNKAMENMVF